MAENRKLVKMLVIMGTTLYMDNGLFYLSNAKEGKIDKKTSFKRTQQSYFNVMD